jgi:hypothetical protein
MAFNAFTSVVLDAERNLLVAKGVSDPANGAGAEIDVAILAVADPDNKRCDGPAIDAGSSDWVAEIPNRDDDPFVGGEAVFVVGAARSASAPLFLWVNKRTIGAKSG